MAQSSLALPSSDILIVDDTPENLRLLSKMLESQGYRVRRSISGRMALHASQIEPPDLVLLDINMPEMDGYEVCRQLKAHPKTLDIPVIFISALDHTQNKVQAFDLGAVDYITKPFQEQEVLSRVKAQLTIQRQQQLLLERNRQLERSQLETRLLLSTIQAANQAADIDMALRAILQEVCDAIGWDYGEAWMQWDTEDALTLRQPYLLLDSQDMNQFQYCSLHTQYQQGEGLVGRVWQTQQPAWQSSLDRHDLLPCVRCVAAHQANLKTAFAVPVVLHDRSLAVLAFYSVIDRALDQRLLDVVSAVALQLGTLIQQKQAEEALRRANLELQRLVSLDGLTQLANRRRFDEYLDQEWRRSRREQQPLSLILCDVDHFKLYNDHYGHQAGDDCLKQIAQAITQSIRRPADLAARYGGEEFAVILPNSDWEGAVHIAQTIQKAIANLHIRHDYSNTAPIITMSLGISSLVPSDTHGATALITVADRALYEAKAKGRNAYQTANMSLGVSSVLF
ncbi:diguanylate cyclase [Leptolyngbya sp. CCY15150]|uniref:diguanylate cyclase domain-containing protein n=1 Tax=Leptolyngbya sp. CCY15150 TaxID=2767772 RepID=UPI001EF2FFCC|nr:diguanylate cyclase [Leptolyngbya sp. CCY15150]